MFIITKRIGEGFSIRNEINLTVLGIHNSYVRLGIEIPDSVDIDYSDFTLLFEKPTKN